MEGKIAVAGAGLAGSLLGAYLAQKGYQVDLIEKRGDFRRADYKGGRSINLALSDRGWKALEKVGLKSAIEEIAIPMYGRMLHDVDGSLSFMPYGKEKQAIYSVSRGELNLRLIEAAAQHPNLNLLFEHGIEKVDFEQQKIMLSTPEGAKESSYDRIIGADGAFSAVRDSMMKSSDRFNYSQSYIPHGYKELSIPPGKVKKWQIDKNCLHIWPRKSFMLIALPNQDGSFTCTLFLAFEGAVSFENLNTAEAVEAFFATYFKDAMDLMPTLVEDFFDNPTSSLVTVRCEPWNKGTNALILGDAAHAIVPFYGQGMNASFEDCFVLAEKLEANDFDWDKVIPEFAHERKPDGDGIAQLALNNFIEMRDLVADPHFVKKRQLSGKVNEWFPEKWLPLYSMVTFSDIPYHKALEEGRRQNKILEAILEKEADLEKIDCRLVADYIM